VCLGAGELDSVTFVRSTSWKWEAVTYKSPQNRETNQFGEDKDEAFLPNPHEHSDDDICSDDDEEPDIEAIEKLIDESQFDDGNETTTNRVTKKPLVRTSRFIKVQLGEAPPLEPYFDKVKLRYRAEHLRRRLVCQVKTQNFIEAQQGAHYRVE
jgi:hypothetical protein